MCDFYIETQGSTENKEEAPINTEEEPDSTTFSSEAIKELLAEYKATLGNNEAKTKPQATNSSANFFEDMGWTRKKNDLSLTKVVPQTSPDIETVMQKSVITPGFEKLHQLPSYHVSQVKLKFLKQKERKKSKGEQWFGLPATEVTPEIKNDLQVLQMRSVLDPKRFYKKNDLRVLPKYFHVGKVMDSPLEYYNNRLTKKERKKTIVDELLANAEFSKFNKRKYKEIIEGKQKTHYKEWKKSKKLKKKNKK